MSSLRALTVTDWDGIGWDALVVRVIERMDDANAHATVEFDAPISTTRKRDGSVPPVAVITFDGNAVRDTHAHGWACNAGYVAHVSW